MLASALAAGDDIGVDATRDARLVAFYESIDEPGRLSQREGRVEFVRTQRLVGAALPPAPARVLDVGGGDGVYAKWLDSLGYDVELVDLTPAHVERARGSGVVAQVGDARALPFESESADAVLLLGPLYHLTSADDRARALAEARRVLRPGGLLAAAGVSRLAVAMDLFRKGRLTDLDALEAARAIAIHGFDDTGYGAGLFYFHTATELADEVRSAGLVVTALHGIEGPVWPLIDPSSVPDDVTVTVAAAIAELADSMPTAVAASAHLLVTATAPARAAANP